MRLAFSQRSSNDFDSNIIFDNFPDGDGTQGRHSVSSFLTP